jgi:hypothetical protein
MGRSVYVAAAVALVLTSCSVLCLGAERFGARECEELGFTGLALCSDCNALAEFVKEQGMGVPVDSSSHVAAASICDLNRERVGAFRMRFFFSYALELFVVNLLGAIWIEMFTEFL